MNKKQKVRSAVRHVQAAPDLVMVKAGEVLYKTMVRTTTKHRLTRVEADEFRTNIRRGRERVEMILHG